MWLMMQKENPKKNMRKYKRYLEKLVKKILSNRIWYILTVNADYIHEMARIELAHINQNLNVCPFF